MYAHLSNSEICRIFRTHHDPLVCELVKRLDEAAVDIVPTDLYNGLVAATNAAQEEIDVIRLLLEDLEEHTNA
jgi:hypothetical protein